MKQKYIVDLVRTVFGGLEFELAELGCYCTKSTSHKIQFNCGLVFFVVVVVMRIFCLFGSGGWLVGWLMDLGSWLVGWFRCRLSALVQAGKAYCKTYCQESVHTNKREIERQ